MLKARISLFLAIVMLFFMSGEVFADCKDNDNRKYSTSGTICGKHVGLSAKNLYSCGSDGSWNLSVECSGGCEDGWDGFTYNPTCSGCKDSKGKTRGPGTIVCGKEIGKADDIYKCDDSNGNWNLETDCGGGCDENWDGFMSNPTCSGCKDSKGKIHQPGTIICGKHIGKPDKVYKCDASSENWNLETDCSGGCDDNWDGFMSNPTCSGCKDSKGKIRQSGTTVCGKEIGKADDVYKCSQSGGNWELETKCSSGCSGDNSGFSNYPACTGCKDINGHELGTGTIICGKDIGKANNLYKCDPSGGTWKVEKTCDAGCEGDNSGFNNTPDCIAKSTTDMDEKNYNPICGNGTEINTALGCVPTEMNKFVPWLLKWLFGVAGGIAFLLMSYGFILIATSGGDEKKVQGARETITSAIVGLIVCIFAVFILQLVAVNILKIPGMN